MRIRGTEPSPARRLWPWLVFALVDMFIQMDINSLCFWLFAFYFFALSLTTFSPAPPPPQQKKKTATSSFSGTVIFFN